jgi:hypothetical protein
LHIAQLDFSTRRDPDVLAEHISTAQHGTRKKGQPKLPELCE